MATPEPNTYYTASTLPDDFVEYCRFAMEELCCCCRRETENSIVTVEDTVVVLSG